MVTLNTQETFAIASVGNAGQGRAVGGSSGAGGGPYIDPSLFCNTGVTTPICTSSITPLNLLHPRPLINHRSIMVREYIKQNKDVLKVIYFPKASSEFNAIEECWRQGKYNLLVSKYYPKFANLTNAISNYYRTRRFKLDILKYLFRNVS